MAETSFQVKYDGPALASGRMPIRDLAPALLALGDLFAEASTTLYPDRPPVALDIHATETGSFGVDLILNAMEGAWEATEQIFGSDGVTALVNLKEIVLGGTTIGLIELIRRLRGRPIESEEPAAEPGLVRVGTGNASLEIPEKVLTLHRKMTIRRSAKAVVEPVGRGGVDFFRAFSQEEVAVEVGREDLPAFDAIEDVEGEEEELPVAERDTTVQITGIFWNAKWRFSEGQDDASFFATIEDSAFLDKIDKGAEAFRKGDLLECTLRTRQRKVGAELKADYAIVRVKRHIKATEQLNIEDAA